VEKYSTTGETTDGNIMQLMRSACWITQGTCPLAICNTYGFSPATIVARTRLSITLYVHCVSCVCVSLSCTYVSIQWPAVSDLFS